MAVTTTVGFGDIYPKTGLGKIIIFVSALLGVILASTYVVALTNSLQLTQAEKNSLIMIKRMSQKDLIKE